MYETLLSEYLREELNWRIWGRGCFPLRSNRVLLHHTAHQEKRICLGRLRGFHKVDSLWLAVHSVGSLADHGTMLEGSPRGCDCSGVLQRLSIPCPVVGMYIQPMVPALGTTSLGRVMCHWDHLDCKHDWTLWGPLFKRLRSWQTDSEIYLSHSHSRPAHMYVPLLSDLLPPIWRGPPLPSISFCHPGTGTVSNFTERLPRLWTSILPTYGFKGWE